MRHRDYPTFNWGLCVPSSPKMDRNMNTLKEWLTYLFGGYKVCCHTNIPRHIQEARGLKEYKRFTLGARIEELNLVVELDIPKDYIYADRIRKTRERDEILHEMGYTVVHIPFWAAWSDANLHHWFGLLFDDRNYHGTTLPSGFWPLRDRSPDLNTTPANFCMLGWNKFMEECILLPAETRKQVIQSMIDIADIHSEEAVGMPAIIHHLSLYDDPECVDFTEGM